MTRSAYADLKRWYLYSLGMAEQCEARSQTLLREASGEAASANDHRELAAQYAEILIKLGQQIPEPEPRGDLTSNTALSMGPARP